MLDGNLLLREIILNFIWFFQWLDEGSKIRIEALQKSSINAVPATPSLNSSSVIFPSES